LAIATSVPTQGCKEAQTSDLQVQVFEEVIQILNHFSVHPPLPRNGNAYHFS